MEVDFVGLISSQCGAGAFAVCSCTEQARPPAAVLRSPSATGAAARRSSSATPRDAAAPPASPSPVSPKRSTRAQVSARSKGAAATAAASSGPTHSSHTAPPSAHPPHCFGALAVPKNLQIWLSCRGLLMAAQAAPRRRAGGRAGGRASESDLCGGAIGHSSSRSFQVHHEFERPRKIAP